MLGICAFFLLSIIGFHLIHFVRKQKQKERSEALNECATSLNTVYEDPDALLAARDLFNNIQPGVLQDNVVPTATNAAYSVKPTDVGTKDNVAYFKAVQIIEDKETNTRDCLDGLGMEESTA